MTNINCTDVNLYSPRKRMKSGLREKRICVQRIGMHTYRKETRIKDVYCRCKIQRSVFLCL